MKAIPAALVIAAFLGTPAVAQSDFVAMAKAELPAESLDLIQSRIAAYTTFQHISPEGVVRWSPRMIKLVEFVKAPSPTYPDTYLYAMRYAVSVIRDKHTLGFYGCQVTVVYRHGEFAEPTVSCQPVKPDLPPLEG